MTTSGTFISEPMKPVGSSFLTAPMVAGEPGLPKTFAWRGRNYEVAELLEKWREIDDCTHGSGERYLRKHCYRVRTSDGSEMKIYFERQPRGRGKARWFLYSFAGSHPAAD